MGDQYRLTLRNESSQSGLTFAIYTKIPQIGTSGDVFPMAWQAKRLNQGNNLTFTWTLDYSIMFSSKGAAAGAVWSENGSISADDSSAQLNCVRLSYDGDYALSHNPGAHPVKEGYIYLDSTGQVPAFSDATGPSVALAIAAGDNSKPMPAVAANSGPNLEQVFELHPTYFVRAGQLVQGQMADVETMTNMQEVKFAPGVFEACWVLGIDNAWSQCG